MKDICILSFLKFVVKQLIETMVKLLNLVRLKGLDLMMRLGGSYGS